MNKRIFIILSSLTVVIGSSYFLSGKLIQQSYYDTIASLNAQPNIQVSLISYNRGLFHSNANIKLVYDSKEIQLQQAITHGPLIMAETPNGFRPMFIATQLKTTFGDEFQQKLSQYTEQPKPLSITTFVNFSKQASTWLKFASLNQTAKNKLHLEWDTIIGELKHDLEFNTYNGSINVPKLIVNNESWNFNVTALALKLNSTNTADHFSHTNTIQTKNLSFSRQGTELIKLDDIEATAELSRDNEAKITLNLLAKISNSHIVEQKFAEDSFKVRINNINHLVLQHLPSKDNLNLQALATFAQQLTAESSQLTIEIPKNFTEALLSYVSYELYRGSVIGQFDKRDQNVIFKDVTTSITSLVQSLLKQNLFVDQGAYYTFDLSTKPAPEAAVS